MLLFVVSCQPVSNDPTKVKTYASLRVGTLYGTQIFINTSQGISGFDYDMAKKFALHINKPLKIKPYKKITDLYDALEKNEIDIIAAGLTETPVRKQKFKLSPPLYLVDQVLIYKSGNRPPKDLAKISGNITVLSDSAFTETLLEFQEKIPHLRWNEVNYYDVEELLEMVDNNSIKYTIVDSTSLQINRRYMPKLRQGQVFKQDQSVVWLLNKNNSDPLMSELLHFWNDIKHTDTLEQLYERYFGHVQRFDYVDTRAFIRAVTSKLPDYQQWFMKYAGELDWRKLAATSYQESHWEPHAKSPTGVRGMMMLTLPTAKQMGVTNRLDPEQSIQGGAKYLTNLLARLPSSIPNSQRIWFALASYNLGMGHVEDARVITQQKGLNPSAWKDVKQILPLLQKKRYYSTTRYGYARGSEAVHYVDSIRRYYDTLVWLDKQYQISVNGPAELSMARNLK